MKYCRNCANEMHDEAVICVKCGVPSGKGSSFCPKCGAPTMQDAAFCVGCGCALGSPAAEPAAAQDEYSDKSKLAAGLLGIFLGGYGVHNFYLGYTGKAIGQIVLTVFTCGIGSIWGFIEGIMILCDKIPDANGKKLKN